MNNDKTLRLAIIGGAMNSAVGYVHFAASQLDANFRVVAGAFSRDYDSNMSTASYWNITHENTFSDWRDLIQQKREAFDVVLVLTPTPHHEEVLLALLDAAIPTICEKALVDGLSSLLRIKQRYSHHKHFLAVTFNYSGYAMVRELQQLISEGRLGVIQKIHMEMPQEGFRRPPDIGGKTAKPQAWRLKDYEVPTICLDLGVHLHHLSTFLLGLEPVETMAEFANHSCYPDLVDDVQMLLRYPNGIKGSMWMSKTAIGHRNGLKIRVYGDQGSAMWYQLNPDELELSFADGRREILDRAGQCDIAHLFRYNRMKPGHPTGFVEAFANLYSDIASDLRQFLCAKQENVQPIYGLAHAEDGLKLFSAAKRSNKTGRWEKVD